MKSILLSVGFLIASQVIKNDNGVDVKIRFESANKYELSFCFDLNVVKDFNYDFNVFTRFRSKTRQDENNIAKNKFRPSELSNHYIIIENESYKKKILFIDYEIIDKRRIAVSRDAFWSTIQNISEHSRKSFFFTKSVFSLSELKVDKADKKVRFLYVSKPLKGNRSTKVIISNWVDVNNVKSKVM